MGRFQDLIGIVRVPGIDFPFPDNKKRMNYFLVVNDVFKAHNSLRT